MPFIQRTLPVLLGIFLLSVLVRLPQLNRPLSKHHEFCTAMALRIMQIWDEKGISHYNYNPVMNYGNAADKYINNHANQTGKMLDAEGNYYYVSHPPFAYYLPYFVFKVLHIKPDVLPLQIFNLLMHFVSGLFVYFTVCLLSFNRARSMPYRSALVAYSIYLFLPATLWFQGNVYMSDMLVHTLFIIGVYTTLKMIIRQKFYVWKYIFFYTTVLALMLYTSWLGVFFAIGVLVYSLLHVQNNKGFRVLVGITAIVSLVMVRLVAYQYSQINGPEAYMSEMLHRYIIRGSLADTNHGLFTFMFGYLWLIKTLFYNYIVNYIVIYAIIGWFIYLVMSRKKLKIVFSENGYRFIWLSVMPVVLLHVFLLNYSAHDFTALYGSLFFSVLLGILYDKVKKSGALPLRTMRIGLVATLGVLVLQFYVINRPDFATVLEQRYSYNKVIGIYINEHAPKDATIFSSAEINPQIIFYAGRNIRFAKNRQEALAFLKSTGNKKGIDMYYGGKFNFSAPDPGLGEVFYVDSVSTNN